MLTLVHSWTIMKNKLLFSDTLINSAIEEYNNLTVLSGASRIGNPSVSDDGSLLHYSFQLSDSLNIEMTEKDNRIVMFGCICKDEAEAGAFLAHCITGCFLLSGNLGGYSAFTEVLDQFLQARADRPSEARELLQTGLVINLTKEACGYLFLIMR